MKKRQGPRRKATNHLLALRIARRIQVRKQLEEVRREFAAWLIREAHLTNQWP